MLIFFGDDVMLRKCSETENETPDAFVRQCQKVGDNMALAT